MEMIMLIVPDKNMVTKKHRIIASVIALIVIAGIFALVIFGLTLIIDKGNLLGIIPLSFAIIISAVQIVLGIVFYKKNHKE
jgi:hypothetical protein